MNNSPVKELAVINKYLEKHKGIDKVIPYLYHLSNLRKDIVNISTKLSKDVMNNLSHYKTKLESDKELMKNKYMYLTIYESILQSIDNLSKDYQFDQYKSKFNLSEIEPLPKCTAEDILLLKSKMKQLNLNDYDDEVDIIKEQLNIKTNYKNKFVFVKSHDNTIPDSWNNFIIKYKNYPEYKFKVAKQKSDKPKIIVYQNNKKYEIYDINHVQHLIDNFNTSSEKPVMWLFHANWCKHCIDFKKTNIWNNLKTKYTNIIFKDVEQSNISKEQKEMFNINGFPTIVFQNNNIIDFNNERTEKNLSQFIDANI